MNIFKRLFKKTTDPGPGIYKVCYFQDCGYAAMTCCVEIAAKSEADARKNFPRYVRDQGYACTALPKDLESIEYVGPVLMMNTREAGADWGT